MQVSLLICTLTLQAHVLQYSVSRQYLRKEFNFWNVHGIMNTSGLLIGLHVNFARDPKYS